MNDFVSQKERECLHDSAIECVDLGNDELVSSPTNIVANLELHPLVNIVGLLEDDILHQLDMFADECSLPTLRMGRDPASHSSST